MHQVNVRQAPAKHIVGFCTAAMLALTAAPAFAHHSGAMFDNTKTVTLTGAVKEFKWVNPHASIEIMTMDPKGAPLLVSVECSTPNILVRHGWGAHSLKPGDMVSMTVHPMRDGGAGAFVLAVTTPTGSVLKDHDY